MAITAPPFGLRSRFFRLWYVLRASYWFYPALMSIGAIGLALGGTALDARLGEDWALPLNLLSVNHPEGARSLLATIAGSMITVAGVTFSITIASLAYATSQFGPRLLTNFMEDEGNQLSLGTFIATFIYCMVVLGSIQTPDDPTLVQVENGADVASGFVPRLSVLIGLLLSLASTGVLIYFIHHVPESIHASNVAANIGRELLQKIGHLYPETIGLGIDEVEKPRQPEFPDRFTEDACRIRSNQNGYLQFVDEDRLLYLARTHDLLIRVVFRPGDFVDLGDELAYAYPPDRVTDLVRRRLADTFVCGNRRTHVQDALFLINELVEIATRALSPGVNDPFTAIGCMDWLGSALIKLSDRHFPKGFRYDDEGTLRVVTFPHSYARYADAVFDQLRPYVREDRNALLHMVKVIGEIGRTVRAPAYRAYLERHADAYLEDGLPRLTLDRDREALTGRHATVVRILRHPAEAYPLAEAIDWIGGSA